MTNPRKVIIDAGNRMRVAADQHNVQDYSVKYLCIQVEGRPEADRVVRTMRLNFKVSMHNGSSNG